MSGASGFIGRELVKCLKAAGADPLVVSSGRSTGYKGASEAKGSRLDDPIYWFEALCQASAEDLVLFHLAAQTSAKVAAQHPELEARASRSISDALVNAIRDYRQGRPNVRVHVVYTSTATVYGRSPRLPVNELCPTSICSDYDQHKIDFELSLREGADQAWFGLTILRLPNVYGSFVDRTSSDRGVLERWIKDAASGRPIVSYGGGNFLRDYLHVSDLCGLMTKVDYCDIQTAEIFNPGTGVGVTIREAQELIVKEVFDRVGTLSHIVNEPFPADSILIDHRDYVADVGKTRDFFGWHAKRSIRDEIGVMVREL